MEKAEFRKNASDMIYLTACAINGKTPKQERIDNLDLPALFEVCQNHILTACTAYALESAGVKDNDFTQAKEKSIRKNILLDAERSRILKRLESERIWYMPLKGSLLKDWYPKLGMRQMSDNDILYDGSFRARIKDIMIDMGFTCEHFGVCNDDAYFKQPVCNFEMHNELFHVANIGRFHEYYENVKDKLIKDENNEFGYHFTDEDYYIYIISHEYKHFALGGTGVRSLVDTYIYLRKFGNSLDWNYIGDELEKLDIVDYERNNRELAMKVFTFKPLTPEEKKLLDYYVVSGTYGNEINMVNNKLQRDAGGSKFRYIFMRFFIPMNKIQAWYPFFYEHKWLIPVLWIYRIFKGIFVKRKKLFGEFKRLLKK